MNKDLTYILHGRVPRGYGELPQHMGDYQRIAPGEQSERYLKLIGGQKMFGSVMKISHKYDNPVSFERGNKNAAKEYSKQISQSHRKDGPPIDKTPAKVNAEH